MTTEDRRQGRCGLHRGWRAALLALTLVGLGDLAPVTVARAEGFDCAAARGKVETLVCADPGLSKLDKELKALFARIEAETWGRRREGNRT